MKNTVKKLFRRFSFDPNVKFIICLIAVIVVISIFLLSYNTVGKTYVYSIGDIAREDIRCPNDIQFIIQSETDMEKKRIAEMVPLVFDKDQSILLKKLREIEQLFTYVTAVLDENPPQRNEDRTFQLISLKDRMPSYLHYDDIVLWDLLKTDNPEKLRRIINRIMIFIYDRGILEAPYDNPLNINNKNITIRTINISEDINEISRTLSDLQILEDVNKNLYNTCYSVAPNKSKAIIGSIYKIVEANIKPNLTFNLEETIRRIDEKTKSVKPITGLLKKGQMLAREGDTITTEKWDNIKILNKYMAKTNISYIIGVLIFLLVIIFLSSYFILEAYTEPIQDHSTPIIVFTQVLFFILYTFLISTINDIQNSDYIFALFLPIPMITMTIATLFSDRFIAVLTGIYIIFFSFIISSGAFSTVILAFSSCILGIIVIRNVEKRTDFLLGGIIIGFINAIVVLSIGLIEEFTLYNILKNIGVSIASGLINAILAMGIFPFYESLFGLTTRFRLLELSDLNAKIFKKMLIRAPGTYNHSLIVANMAESACEAIGADPILARVGGYYHDIGKLSEAKYYVENKASEDLPNLSPHEYSKLIISHVRKGVDLAIENNLPESVIDFIREHHGTSTMTYFYHQALENAESKGQSETVDKKDFEYPGPKPSNRETAIVMIADSVEAASRSIQEPNAIKLEGLVKKIIYNKLNEGELDNSDLHMSDLNLINKAILRVLNGVFHTRMEYPEDEEIKKLEDKVLKNNSDED